MTNPMRYYTLKMCLRERKYAQTKYIYSLFIFHVFFCTAFTIHMAPFVFGEIQLLFSDFSSNFSIKTYIVAPHLNQLTEVVQMRYHNISFMEISERGSENYQHIPHPLFQEP